LKLRSGLNTTNQGLIGITTKGKGTSTQEVLPPVVQTLFMNVSANRVVHRARTNMNPINPLAKHASVENTALLVR